MIVCFECHFLLLSSFVYIFSEPYEHGERRVLDRPRSGEYPASHVRSAARAIDYLHLAFDFTPEVEATSALCEFSRRRLEGQLYNCHEAFANEVAMYAELRRARSRSGADEHEGLRWQQWARRYRNAPYSAELGPHNAPPGAGGHNIRSQQPLITSASHQHRAPHAQGCLPRALLMLTTCRTPHRVPHTIHRALDGHFFEKEGMLLRPVAQLYGQVRTDWNQCFVIDCSLGHPAGHKPFTCSHSVLRNT